MTTVVANLECMAADHRVTGESILCHTTKIYRIGDNLYGLCGDVMMALYVIEWLQGKRDKESLHKAIGIEQRSHITVMELSQQGLALIDGWGMRMPLLDKYFAIGSGAAAAYTDLRRGSSPQDAIRAACFVDEASGIHPDFPPQVEYLLPPELTKKRRGK